MKKGEKDEIIKRFHKATDSFEEEGLRQMDEALFKLTTLNKYAIIKQVLQCKAVGISRGC